MKLRDMINIISNDLKITLVFATKTPLSFEMESRGAYIQYEPVYKTLVKYLDNEVIGMYIIDNKHIKLLIKEETI
ncbi:hypothetical protein [Enterococcus phage EF-M80]|nr:hypothetical protein [Enterococcus phage EF-M80]